MGKSKVSDIRLHEKSIKEDGYDNLKYSITNYDEDIDKTIKDIDACGHPRGCCNDNSRTYETPESIKETSTIRSK